MTITAIMNAMESLEQLYVDSSMIEVLFIEEVTETIQIKYVGSGINTFVTKSSISDKKSEKNYVKLDDTLIIRFEGIGCIE